MATSWKKLSQKTLLLHPRINIYEDDVQLPSGYQTKYLHFGEGHDAAMVIPISEKGLILVQKEYSYPPNEWLYQFPGGALDEGESPEAGALRELAEEAGVTSNSLCKIGWFYIDNRRRANKFHVYVGTGLSPKTAQADPEETFETFWFTEQEIDTMIRDGKMVNYSFLAAWALYRAAEPYETKA